jgi:hypothetical protein
MTRDQAKKQPSLIVRCACGSPVRLWLPNRNGVVVCKTCGNCHLPARKGE